MTTERFYAVILRMSVDSSGYDCWWMRDNWEDDCRKPRVCSDDMDDNCATWGDECGITPTVIV